MPLYKTIYPKSDTTILVWKITETYLELFEHLNLKPASLVRISSMKSELHQRAFLSIRKLLKIAGYSDFDLQYDITGKPSLVDNKFVSISHSHQFATIVISSQKVGIDIEKIRDKTAVIANKFCSEVLDQSDRQQYIQKLTTFWGVKEAIFKIENQKGISFKDHIIVQDYDINEEFTSAILHFEQNFKYFKVQFAKIDEFMLVWVFEN